MHIVFIYIYIHTHAYAHVDYSGITLQISPVFVYSCADILRFCFREAERVQLLCEQLLRFSVGGGHLPGEKGDRLLLLEHRAARL